MSDAKTKQLVFLKHTTLCVQIVRCSDPLMWYSNMVGHWMPIVRITDDGVWSREPDGYINIIKFEDIIP